MSPSVLLGFMKTSSIQDPKKRFAFGKNWSKFLDSIDEDRIQEAQKSLCGTLGIHDFSGKTFLDIGSGSGLFSLAAHRLGARVYSFDYDLQSVDCTKALKEKYAKNTNTWSVEQGSVLDGEFLKKFDNIDIVYSWGVLHHTGHMHQALQNVSGLVRGGGSLFISIYNDQGKPSKIWKKIKKLYVDYPYCRGILTVFCGLWLWRYQFILGLVRHGNPLYFSE